MGLVRSRPLQSTPAFCLHRGRLRDRRSFAWAVHRPDCVGAFGVARFRSDLLGTSVGPDHRLFVTTTALAHQI